MKAETGADIICNGCKIYSTEKCVKWHFWENVSPGYALASGECCCKEIDTFLDKLKTISISSKATPTRGKK